MEEILDKKIYLLEICINFFYKTVVILQFEIPLEKGVTILKTILDDNSSSRNIFINYLIIN
jgi:hypothetical protein